MRGYGTFASFATQYLRHRQRSGLFDEGTAILFGVVGWKMRLICQTSVRVDCTIDPVSIIWANAMLGEVTPPMAENVTTSPAFNLLFPLFQENTEIIGGVPEPLPHLMQDLVEKRLTEILDHV